MVYNFFCVHYRNARLTGDAAAGSELGSRCEECFKDLCGESGTVKLNFWRKRKLREFGVVWLVEENDRLLPSKRRISQVEMRFE